MGGFTPLGAAITVLQIGQAVAERQAAGRREQDRLAAERQVRADEIAAQQQAEARDRQDRLRRALARQRALFGSQGIAPEGGSAGALLAGLEQEAAEDEADSRRRAALRLRGLTAEPASRSAFDLLDVGSLTQSVLRPATRRTPFGSLLDY